MVTWGNLTRVGSISKMMTLSLMTPLGRPSTVRVSYPIKDAVTLDSLSVTFGIAKKPVLSEVVPALLPTRKILAFSMGLPDCLSTTTPKIFFAAEGSLMRDNRNSASSKAGHLLGANTKAPTNNMIVALIRQLLLLQPNQ